MKKKAFKADCFLFIEENYNRVACCENRNCEQDILHVLRRDRTTGKFPSLRLDIYIDFDNSESFYAHIVAAQIHINDSKKLIESRMGHWHAFFHYKNFDEDYAAVNVEEISFYIFLTHDESK